MHGTAWQHPLVSSHLVGSLLQLPQPQAYDVDGDERARAPDACAAVHHNGRPAVCRQRVAQHADGDAMLGRAVVRPSVEVEVVHR
eukprot:365237-Chlamydomonas_euryale.AAC.8